MKLASSLYKGGELIDASEADYEYSRELGIICPFCKESVFLAREHIRKNSNVRATWRHYKALLASIFCEERALSVQGKEILRQLQPEAQGQRLRLFNRRFWDIYRYDKHVPPLDKCCARYVDNQKINEIVRHCKERWDVPAILAIIPKRIEDFVSERTRDEVLKRYADKSWVSDGIIQSVIDNLAKSEYSVLRHKILSEVIEWLPTPTASSSFRKLMQLALLDCIDISRSQVQSTGAIANMAVSSLILTDWELAIANLKEPLKGLGFGKD